MAETIATIADIDISEYIPIPETEDGSIKVADPTQIDLSDFVPVEDPQQIIGTPPLSAYLKYKWRKGFLPMVRGSYGREAMWERMDSKLALDKGNKAYLEQLEKAGNLRDISFREDPIKAMLGESAQLMPLMFSSMEEGLKTGLMLGGGFAAITAVAGVTGPLALTPEEIITVPGSFATGMGLGMAFGIVKHSMDGEGGNLY